MEKLFFEVAAFTAWVVRFLSDEDYAVLQGLLRTNPEAGDVIPGTGGARKIRIPDRGRGKGKRGGARVLYLHIPEVNWIWFLKGFSKDMQEDITPLEKKHLAQLAQECREVALGSGRK